MRWAGKWLNKAAARVCIDLRVGAPRSLILAFLVRAYFDPNSLIREVPQSLRRRGFGNSPSGSARIFWGMS